MSQSLPRLRRRPGQWPGQIIAVLDLEFGDEDVSLLLVQHSTSPFYVRASDDELRRLPDNGAGWNDLITEVARPQQVVPQERLESMLAGLLALGYHRLRRSPRDPDPLDGYELRRNRAAMDALCARDADCNGMAHLWLTVIGDEVAPIWHIDRRTGRVVPPLPLLMQREQG